MNISFPKSVDNPLTVKSLTDLLGDYLSIIGDLSVTISSVASPFSANNESIVFCNKDDLEELIELIKFTKAAVIIAKLSVDVCPSKCLIVVNDPLEWFIKALNILFNLKHRYLIHPATFISDNSRIGKNVSIGSGTFIDINCVIGDGCIIGTNCYFGPGTILGKNVFIQNNSSIGSVGLGYHVNSKSDRIFFPHLGIVYIGDDVVIGSNSVIVRGELDDTVVGDRCRFGNLVNIGHNVKIGHDCSVSSGTCIAGGVKVGNDCNIAAGVVLNAKIIVGNGCRVGLGSVVVRNIPDGQSVFGNPAKPLPTMRSF